MKKKTKLFLLVACVLLSTGCSMTLFIASDNNKVKIDDEVETRTRIHLQSDTLFLKGKVLHTLKKYESEDNEED